MQDHRRKLPANVAKTLGPQLRFALSHPTRRRILRTLNETGHPQTLENLSHLAPHAGASTIRYHVMVLEECAASKVVALPLPDGSGRGYASNATDDRVVMEALQATQLLDEPGGEAPSSERSATPAGG